MCSLISWAQTTHFYISAHPDDWQLFMNPNAYKDVKTDGSKVVFIHTTAGDAGSGTGNNNYYLAREEGSLRALRFMSNVGNIGLGINMNKSYTTVNGHNILKFSYRNIVAYFLRLPDGNTEGNGFRLSNYSSLKKFYEGAISSMKAVDNTATYTSIDDLKATLKSIITAESQGTSLSFNMADTNKTINPNDHPDHLYSSRIIQDILRPMTDKSIKINFYIDDHSSSLSKNLSEDDYLIKVGTWGATNSGITDNSHRSTWEPIHNNWLGRQYFRTQIPDNNLAIYKPTTTSSSQYNTPGTHANDGDDTTYWGASPYAQWWQVDLQADYNLNKLNVINYYDGTRYYQYEIMASQDGINWVRVVDFTNNKTPATPEGNTFTLNNITARYLKVNMKYNSANKGVHIIEFKAYGNLSTYTNPLAADKKNDLLVSEKKISVSPNPIKQGGTLKLNNLPHDATDINVKIYDMNTNEIYNKKFYQQRDKEIEIPLQNLNKGIYIVNISFSDIVQNSKIIIE